MELTAKALADYITEEVIYDPGPCIYPGTFKPPHKGYYKAVADLASRHYIQEVHVVISSKEEAGITAQQSLKAWQTFLKYAPLQKVTIAISPYASPVEFAFKFIEARPQQKPVYLAGGEESEGDKNYFQSLQKRFGEQVLTIAVKEEIDGVTDEKIRQALKTGNYEEFKTCIPEAVVNKGAAEDLFKSLASTIQEIQRSPIKKIIALPDTACSDYRLKEILEHQGYSLFPSQTKEKAAVLSDFLTYCYTLLEIQTPPEIEPISDFNFPQQYYTFGTYSPTEKKICVYVNNRNMADILRTLAHELVHHKQNEVGVLQEKDGDTGSEIENEANAVAAMLLRDYGRKNPQIYE